MNDINLMATLRPSQPGFAKQLKDERLQGIRYNAPMIPLDELRAELAQLAKFGNDKPVYFDAKGRQLRVEEVIPHDDHLDLRLNHPISVSVNLPITVRFKAGCERALLVRVEEDGRRLIFESGPPSLVRAGESLHANPGSPFQVKARPLFTLAEKERLAIVRAHGIKRFCLSYVERARDIDEFREVVGNDVEIKLKIETERGLEFVEREFRKMEGVSLVNARGDLYVEMEYLVDLIDAHRLIIEKDPEATLGSRLLLSLVTDHFPSCADLAELAWLYDIGYRNFMLCDDLCLKEPLLNRAIDVFDGFRWTYPERAKNGRRRWGSTPKPELAKSVSRRPTWLDALLGR